MSSAKRGRDEKRAVRKTRHGKPGERFATMRQDALVAAACSLSSVAVRILLLANAGWSPTLGANAGGKVALGYSAIEHPNGEATTKPAARIGRSTIAAALSEVLAGGWLVLVKPGARPGGAGGARGAVATYDVPHRHGENAPRIEMPPNARRPKGKLRLHSSLIRSDAAALSPQALHVLAYAAAFRDRTDEGAIVDPEPFQLPAAEVAQRLGLARSTGARAIAELVEAGRLKLSEERKGRRPARYLLARPYAAFRRRGG